MCRRPRRITWTGYPAGARTFEALPSMLICSRLRGVQPLSDDQLWACRGLSAFLSSRRAASQPALMYVSLRRQVKVEAALLSARPRVGGLTVVVSGATLTLTLTRTLEPPVHGRGHLHGNF